jgi:hypothetical protein
VRSVDVIFPVVIIVVVSEKLPESVSNFLFSGSRIVGRAPVVHVCCKVVGVPERTQYFILATCNTGTNIYFGPSNSCPNFIGEL